MRLLKKIIALICIIAISLSCLVVPAFAVDVGGMGDLVSGVADFGQWAIDSSIYGIKLVARIFDEDVCPERPGGVNTAHSFVVNTTTKDGVLADWYVCEYCGFNSGYKADSESLSAAYDEYVETLPAPAYSSGNELRWRLNISSYTENNSVSVNSFVGGSSFSVQYLAPSWGTSFPMLRINVDEFKAPVSGNYHLGCWFSGSSSAFRVLGYSAPSSRRYYLLGDASSLSLFADSYHDLKRGQYYEFSNVLGFAVGQTVVKNTYFSFDCPATTYETFGGYIDVICVPASSLSADTYNINTRPTSITGGNYGIVGDNGQITKVEDNSTIINETNNTYYNPATGQTVPITGWTYDYSDRSYKVTLESGDTATITYGDENITIQEGDTIYNVYYLIDGSGSDNPPCEHDWQEGEATVPTCVRPGSASYVCSLCGQTKTESIPALGHNWQVKQTVTTQYDDTGQLVQAGYTIFECSTCHEQYKSPDGTIPPGGGSGTDPGGEEEGGGFLSWLLGKLGELLGTIGDGILNLLQTALDKIFGGLIDLVNSLFENLAKLMDLFGSVGEAFQVLWTWLPPEITAILVAGVSIFVFVALLKFFMK